MTDKEQRALIKSLTADLRKTKEGYVDNPTGVHWRNAMRKLKELEASVTPQPNRVPNLGPIVRSDKSVLKHDCTHYTDGVGWPAFDVMGAPGTDVIALENLTIYDNTSGAQGGDAFYARGASGMLYWYAHITYVPRQGASFKKGAKLTEISREHASPHVHLAINSVPLIGHHLISKRDYSHGAPLIGLQLARVLNS